MEDAIKICVMKPEDYDKVYSLWNTIRGFGIRSIDDSKEGVTAFLKRNPTTSMLAVLHGQVIGSVLCGHDGRTGYLYHVCVAEEYRKHGIGKAMVAGAMEALKKEGINKVALLAFRSNEIGNCFWKGVGWTQRTDVNYYDFILNTENITAFIG